MGFSNRQAASPKKALTHEHKQSIQQLIKMSIFSAVPARKTNIGLYILDVSVISVYSKCLKVCTFLFLFSNNNVDFQK